MEEERRAEVDPHGCAAERETERLRQLLWTVSNRGYFRENCGCESKKNEEKAEGEGEEDGEYLEMKGGEKTRELKCLQVDLKLMKVFNGRNESTRSSRSSGIRLHIFGSICCDGYHNILLSISH